MSGHAPSSAPPLRDIWTRLAVDPLADPVALVLSRHRVVTPNRVTMVSGLLGVAAIACLATGHLAAGGLLSLLRFFADCVDGKVARAQGSGSARGALLDVATDVVCVVGAYAALTAWAVTEGHLHPLWAGALMAVLGWYGWALAHRKHLAALAGVGDGSSRLVDQEGSGPWGAWLGLCRRLHMRPVPWAVEVETLVLGLLPLLGPGFAVPGLHLALLFYGGATVVNLARMARIAAALDARSVTSTPTRLLP